MSLDIGVFYTERPHSDDEAMARYIAYCEEDDLLPYIEASPKVQEFLEELTTTYPQIDDVPEDELEGCPWACAFNVSQGHVLMPMVLSKYEEAALLVLELAQKHGLVCVDPQSGTILVAPSGIHKRIRKRWWRFWR